MISKTEKKKQTNNKKPNSALEGRRGEGRGSDDGA